MSTFKSIMRGLNEAVKYQEGKIDARKTKIAIKPTESFSSEDIKQIRQKVGMSQSVFAASLSVSKKTVEAWESGRNSPAGSSRRLLQLFRDDPAMVEQYIIIA